MKEISDDEYKEYLKLKEKAPYFYSMKSAKEIIYLEDDIDTPIKSCVAMFALFQCEPTFSCCGFEYDGQPLHKTHQMRNPYIRMGKNPQSSALLSHPPKIWTCRKFNDEILVEFITKDKGNPHWRNPTCIHFAEEILDAIRYLENSLIANKKNFVNKVTIKDTNHLCLQKTRFWQYPPKKPWTIYKEDYL